MQICYFGTYRGNYPRNRLMIDRLRKNGIEVIESHEEFWGDTEQRAQIAHEGWLSPKFLFRLIFTYGRLLKRFITIKKIDAIMVGFPGLTDVLFARVLAWSRKKPLIWDTLMSLYLIAQERNPDRKMGYSISMIRALEWLACRMPDRFIFDTQEYADWFIDNYHVPPYKIFILPIGTDENIYKPSNAQPINEKSFRCVYYGSFIPSHGLRYIVEAARILKYDPTIHFILIGSGPQYKYINNLTKEYALANTTLTGFLDQETLLDHIANADVCLGTFANTPQSLISLQNRIQECMAMAKPIINGDSPVMKKFFKHKENIYICERENAQSIADAILDLRDYPDLRERISTQAYRLYTDCFSSDILGNQMAKWLTSMII